MSFGADRFEDLENVASKGISLSEAGYAMKRVAINASAHHPCVCKICLILSHNIYAGWDLTLHRRTGFGELWIICMST